MNQNPDYIQLEGVEDIEMSSTLRLLSGRSSRKISSNSTARNCLQQSIDSTVERNPCQRIGVHQACRDGLTKCVERILQAHPADLNSQDSDGFTPLHHAARGNHLDIIRILLAAGADLNSKASRYFETPLTYASKFDSYDACRLLIQNGANALKSSCNGQTPLHYASRKGGIRTVEVLLNEGNTPVNIVDNDKATPLHTAAQAGQAEVIHKLIFYGADMCMRDNDGYTPLHLAAREGHFPVFKDLLRKAATSGLSVRTLLNSPDNYGNTSLHLAIKNGHREIAQLCLEYGADLSTAQATDSSTPLHLACTEGNLEITKLLVNYGAKIESEDMNGLTPLLRASLGGHVPIIEFLLDQGAQLYPTTNSFTPSPLMCAVKRSRHEAVAFYLSRGFPLCKYKDLNWRTVLHVAVACADIQTVDLLLENDGHKLLESKDQYGKTCLHYAAVTCNADVVARLIAAGANLRARDNEERIPLHFAAECGTTYVLRLLLNACPETVNEIDYGSRTPLHFAASKGKVEIATHLLQNGAAVDYRDDDRLTPLFHAAICGCPLTMETLLHHGADINALEKNRKTPLIKASYFGHLCAVKRLLKFGADPTIVSTAGFNCLDAAILAKKEDVCMELMKHERWREILSNKKYEGVSPMRRLIEHFPRVAKLVMDRCIERSAHLDTDPKFSITFDFSFISPKPGENIDINNQRYCGAKTMLNYCREDLLFHPLTGEMIRMRWRHIGLTVFLFGAFFYLIFLGLFSHYMCCGQSTSHNNTLKICGEQTCQRDQLKIQEILMALFCFANLLLELYQLYTERWLYLEIGNFIEVLAYVTTLITLLPADGRIGENDSPIQYGAGIIALLLAYVVMLVQLQLLFCSGIYVTMLFEVLKSVLRVVTVFSLLIVAYGIIFFLLLGDELSYTSPLMSVLKVFDMMSGGVEFNYYFVNKLELAMPHMARFICFTFFLIMSISLMNLLIGLAVGDIESVQKNAELKRLSTQIEALYQFEEKISMACRQRIHKSHLVIFPNSDSMSFLKKATWHLGLSDYAPWRIQMQNGSTSEDKINGFQQQLDDHRDSIKQIQTDLRSQRTILENISYHLGASRTNNATNLLDDL